ncbi:MAG: NAD(P)-binding protein, partial [Clostridiales Family XIII bacterium]|nr:NAD(P)-binding protein [Clostridiales Family XIII bacterium]
MNFQEIRVYAEGCLRDTPPPCSCVCPFSIDIRGLAEQVLNGRYERAFRAYRDAVLFPGIVSKLCAAPCGEVCVRAKIFDGKVDLPAIERGIVERASKTEPVRYAVPRKKERIAVVGGGMSGLACTLRLASKGYALTLYEAAEKVGGRVLGLLGQDVTEADVNRAFRYIDYELRLGEEISLAAFDAVCAENDAVYVATGAGGAAFGLLEGRDDRTSSTLRAGVFLGGSLTGTDPAGSIENGIRAASAAEEYLKTGRGGGLGPLFDKAAVDGRFYDLTYRFETPAAGSAAGS